MTIQNMVEEIGLLIAGTQTIGNGKTLREVKPEKYKPQTEFGTWLENTVKTTIKRSNAEYHRSLMEEIASRKELIPLAQKEVVKKFNEKFGHEIMKSNEKLDKIMGNSIISKMAVIAKENGINHDIVDSTIREVVQKVLNSNKIKV